jgi:hypothetical protein
MYVRKDQRITSPFGKNILSLDTNFVQVSKFISNGGLLGM